MEKGLVSVIIPTYNRAHLIGRTLASVKSQSLSKWECIIVDDFSTDCTKEFIDKYAIGDSRFIYYLNERKKGAQGARNTGVLHANGEYVVLFDSDNVMHCDFLEKTIEELKRSGADICGSFSNVIDQLSGETIGEFVWRGYGRIHQDVLICKSYFDNSSTVIRKSKLLEISLLDEECPSFQEWDTHIRLSKIASYTTLQIKLVDYFRGGLDTISASKEKEIKGVLYILNKFKSEYILRHPFYYLRRLYGAYYLLRQFDEKRSNSTLSITFQNSTSLIMRIIIKTIYYFKYRR